MRSPPGRPATSLVYHSLSLSLAARFRRDVHTYPDIILLLSGSILLSNGREKTSGRER